MISFCFVTLFQLLQTVISCANWVRLSRMNRYIALHDAIPHSSGHLVHKTSIFRFCTRARDRHTHLLPTFPFPHESFRSLSSEPLPDANDSRVLSFDVVFIFGFVITRHTQSSLSFSLLRNHASGICTSIAKYLFDAVRNYSRRVCPLSSYSSVVFFLSLPKRPDERKLI